MATMRDQRLKSQDEVTALREHYAKLQRQWAAALEEATRGYAELKQHHFDHHRDLEDAGLTKQHLAGTGEIKAALAAAEERGYNDACKLMECGHPMACHASEDYMEAGGAMCVWCESLENAEQRGMDVGHAIDATRLAAARREALSAAAELCAERGEVLDVAADERLPAQTIARRQYAASALRDAADAIRALPLEEDDGNNA